MAYSAHTINVTLSMKARIVRTSMHIEKKTKFKNYLWNYTCYWKIFTRIDGASNQQSKLQINKNYILPCSPGYGEFENLCFVSVAWTVSVSRVCARRKQNHYCFLGKTSTTHKFNLRVISIAYLFSQSLVNILS